MKILFSMRHPGALRNFASTIREMARRGHQIRLAFMMQDKLGDGRLLWELTNDYPNITFGELGKKTPWRFWLGLARGVRSATDYLRYCTPEYAQAHALRERAEERVAGSLRVLLRLPGMRSRAGVRFLGWMFHIVERAIPTDRWIADLIRTQNPDAV